LIINAQNKLAPGSSLLLRAAGGMGWGFPCRGRRPALPISSALGAGDPAQPRTQRSADLTCKVVSPIVFPLGLGVALVEVSLGLNRKGVQGSRFWWTLGVSCALLTMRLGPSSICLESLAQ